MVGVHEGLQKKSRGADTARRLCNEHGLPQERFYNLLCLAYGSGQVLFDDLTQVGYLPPTRGPRCKREYEKLAYAFHKEISPHIDQEMAKRVLQTNWLPGPVLRERPK